jgi:hypothetical protein
MRAPVFKLRVAEYLGAAEDEIRTLQWHPNEDQDDVQTFGARNQKKQGRFQQALICQR